MPPKFAKQGGRRQTIPFDATVPEGVDPEAVWRFYNSGKENRKGSTSGQRAGLDPNYTPGYGRSAANNREYGFTPQAQWDAQFEQVLTPEANARHKNWLWKSGGAATPENTGLPQYGLPGDLPPAAKPESPANPESGEDQVAALNPSPVSMPVRPQTPAPMPRIETTSGAGQTVRRVAGLPSGQSASATFVKGQNSPSNLAKRTRPPIDPLA